LISWSIVSRKLFNYSFSNIKVKQWNEMANGSRVEEVKKLEQGGHDLFEDDV
jgi:hypothetical protein